MKRILPVPKVTQDGPYCGPASLSMLFQYYRKNVSMYEIVGVAGGQYALKNGMDIELVSHVAQTYQFDHHSLTDLSLDNLIVHIDEKHPLLSVAKAAHKLRTIHYYLITGYDSDKGYIYVNDPAKQPQRFDADEFFNLWDLRRRNLPRNRAFLIHPHRKHCPSHHYYNPIR